MAVGDDAKAAGFSLVPGSGEEGKMKYGAREINRTRDYIAQLKQQVPSTKEGWRGKAVITFGDGDPRPQDGVEGEIYFRLI